jgi:hypothetical protein
MRAFAALAVVILALAGCGHGTQDAACADFCCYPGDCPAGFTCAPSRQQCVRVAPPPDAGTADGPAPDVR